MLSDAFVKQGLTVSGQCKLLAESEMRTWVIEKKPSVIFEMNRVKDEIPILHELNIIHVTWIVDMEGRDESHIKGSDITYTFDPGWVLSFNTGGFTTWLPPGTCTQTFYPIPSFKTKEFEFSFIGHIPRPWSDAELSRLLIGPNKTVTFNKLITEYLDFINIETYREKDHQACVEIINGILEDLLGEAIALPRDMLYDLLIRAKRMRNRTELLSFALRKSDSTVIYGSSNWLQWSEYAKFYRKFVDKEAEINLIHQQSKINLHDGVGFHFRAIDCLASGGLLFWYNDNEGDKYETYQFKNLDRSKILSNGLHDFFEDQYNYFEFKWLNFDDVYEKARLVSCQNQKALSDTVKLVQNHHTWHCRVRQILADISQFS